MLNNTINKINTYYVGYVGYVEQQQAQIDNLGLLTLYDLKCYDSYG